MSDMEKEALMLQSYCNRRVGRLHCNGRPVVGLAMCIVCGKYYRRCADHGGQGSAMRSCRSHVGLHHGTVQL